MQLTCDREDTLMVNAMAKYPIEWLFMQFHGKV